MHPAYGGFTNNVWNVVCGNPASNFQHNRCQIWNTMGLDARLCDADVDLYIPSVHCSRRGDLLAMRPHRCANSLNDSFELLMVRCLRAANFCSHGSLDR